MEGVEGSRRWAAGAVVVFAVACAAASGCGSSDSSVTTKDPQAAFAPMVHFAPDERWFPMGGQWFVDRSILGWSANLICPDPKIAAGPATTAPAAAGLPRLRASGLGKGPPYRYAETTADCKTQGPRRFVANEHNRPYDKKGESTSLDTTEGFFLDLDNVARTGEARPELKGDRLPIGSVPAYAETKREEVDGEDGLKISYWLLYGLHKAGEYGLRFWEATHEGDWERFDVLVKRRGADGYEPFAVRYRYEGKRRQAPWGRLKLSGPDGTHPVISAERGTHQMSPANRSSCRDCPRWDTWAALEPLDDQPWNGFGGAWGGWAPTPAGTGPLGPNGGPEAFVDQVIGARALGVPGSAVDSLE
jgi:hypothetical protein